MIAPDESTTFRERFEMAIWIPGGIGAGAAIIGVVSQDLSTLVGGLFVLFSSMFAQRKLERNLSEVSR